MPSKQNDDLTQVKVLRQFYEKAVENADVAEKMLEKLKRLRTKTTMQIAYEAAFEAFMAKKAWNPYDKLAHVDMSKRIFKQIVEKDPENIEYRFLRLSMNHHLPSFLQETRWLEEDKAKLYHHFTQPDLDGSLEWNAYILRFLLDKKLFAPLQEEKLKIIYESMTK